MALDQLIDSYTPYTVKSIISRLYIAPFILFYLTWLCSWIFVYGVNEYWEFGWIVFAAIAVVQVLCVLFCHWFVAVNCFFTCSYEPIITKAHVMKVVPTPNSGWEEIVPLEKMMLKSGETKLWFEFQKAHYCYDRNKNLFRTVELDTYRPMSYFQQSKGLDSEEIIEDIKQNMRNNRMDMVIPKFIELFQERATAPFFVFQVFCVGLWCLEDMWYYSLFTLFMLMTFEATLVKQQLKNMSQIRNMGNKPYHVYVYRNRRWSRVQTDDLLPGDIISVGRLTDERVVPCDLLLLRGPCIVDESLLTGEIVPQMKDPIEDLEKNRYFDIDADSRLHVIFGGTKIVQHTSPAKNEPGLKAPDGGCICFVLRTGFSTSQGKLLRTILFGVKRVTANNLETLAFILFLLLFAIAAASYLWIKGSQDQSRSKYKLFLECSLILTSVIPPELPIELSLAVNNSLLALQKLGIFCTEPFRIPFAGKIDICCFDKTGTLTTDNLIVEGVASCDQKLLEDNYVIKSPLDVPAESLQVLAACHSLIRFDDELVGDPLEKACLNWIEWSLTKNDTVIPRRSKMLPLTIFHRYHFSSSLKRMTVIAGYLQPGTNETKHIVLVKGAPETLKDMYSSVPDSYDTVFKNLTLRGTRVLALGIKKVNTLSYHEMRTQSREEFEKGLNFAGFVVISCPLKSDTKVIIKEIIDSSHKVVIITGDNPLTACHIAKVLRFVKKSSTILILDEPSEVKESWSWMSVDGHEKYDLTMGLSGGIKHLCLGHELCITGPAFKYLIENDMDLLRRFLPHIKVYARMAPKQKERAVIELKQLGNVTLMCGDGTNDVGALKHADVGVALLSRPFDSTQTSDKSGSISQSERDADKPTPHRNSSSVSNQHHQLYTALAGKKFNCKESNRRTNSGGGLQNPVRASTSDIATRRLQRVIKDMEEEENAQIVKLGDASIAAPFTSKYSSIKSICQVIKQGRCTLVTTLQMYKIMALNALIMAYGQSVLYLDGIKFSDGQATTQGILLAACFLFISRSRPLDTLAKQRPIPNIFNTYTLLTVSLQFFTHFGCLLFVVQAAKDLEPRENIDLSADFKPSLLNSAVYIMSMALQVSTFAVNYRGRPFMEGLVENKPMLYSLLFSGTAVIGLASGMLLDVARKFELVDLPNELRSVLLPCVALDFVLCFIIDRIICMVFGDLRVRI